MTLRKKCLNTEFFLSRRVKFCSRKNLVRYHSFSKYATLREKLTLLPPDTQVYVCVSGFQKCKFFGKFSARTKWMIPDRKWRLMICIWLSDSYAFFNQKLMFCDDCKSSNNLNNQNDFFKSKFQAAHDSYNLIM